MLRLLYNFVKGIFETINSFIVNLILLFLYSINVFVVINLLKLKFLPVSVSTKINRNYSLFLNNVSETLSNSSKRTIPRIDLIDLSVKNMRVKKTRTLVTVIGVGVGFGAIVLLVSLGYGIQELIIQRVAKLEELKQADVAVIPGSNMVINDDTIRTLQKFHAVTRVLPLITTVAKVGYNNSSTDVAAYGVTPEYLSNISLAVSSGKVFKDFVYLPQESPITQAVPQSDPITTSSAVPTTDLKKDTASAIANMGEDWVELVDTQATKIVTARKLPIAPNVISEIVVNKALLRIFGLSEQTALNKKIKLSLIATTVENGVTVTVTSEEQEFEIVGVVSDDTVPQLFLNISTLKQLGVQEYTQLRVLTKTPEDLAFIRQSIQTLGYGTTSVVDTVTKINSLFASIRAILALMGSVALVVAALGMFNTLTVSLLERTREIGLMKALGMKSQEIQDLFLTESIVMGFSGGLLGLLIGFIAGKVVSLLFSVLTVTKGIGFVSISMIPPVFVLQIIFLSFVIGVATGLYPARRATRISALDALRYE